MPLDRKLRKIVEESRQSVAAMTPEENRRAAALLRATKPRLDGRRQREIAEELATEFEARAPNQDAGSPPPPAVGSSSSSARSVAS